MTVAETLCPTPPRMLTGHVTFNNPNVSSTVTRAMGTPGKETSGTGTAARMGQGLSTAAEAIGLFEPPQKKRSWQLSANIKSGDHPQVARQWCL